MRFFLRFSANIQVITVWQRHKCLIASCLDNVEKDEDLIALINELGGNDNVVAEYLCDVKHYHFHGHFFRYGHLFYLVILAIQSSSSPHKRIINNSHTGQNILASLRFLASFPAIVVGCRCNYEFLSSREGKIG